MDNMRERFATTATELLDTDPRLALVLADISTAQFAPAAARHPERVINVGIREQLLISVAGGLALAGLRPIVHTFSSFLIERPFEQIKLDLTHQDVGAVLVSYGGSYDMTGEGRTHQAPGDVALISTLDDWAIHVPGHPDEAEALLRTAAAAGGRAYLRLSSQTNPEPRPVGQSRLDLVRRGNTATVLAVGPMLAPVLDAVASLDLTVLYATTIRPFDARTLHSAVTAARTADVILVEPYLTGTSTPQLSEALAGLPHRLLNLGISRTELRRYGTTAEHAAAHGLDPASLRQRIASFLTPEPSRHSWQAG